MKKEWLLRGILLGGLAFFATPADVESPGSIKNVLAVMTSTGVNIRHNLMAADTDCQIMANYCLTMRAWGGLHGDQIGQWVREMPDLGSFDALVLYDEANTIKDGGSADQAKNEHQATLNWLGENYPRLKVLSMTVLDELTPDPWGQKAKERVSYNLDLINHPAVNETVVTDKVDFSCFGPEDKLHIIKRCQAELVEIIKAKLDEINFGPAKQ